MEIILSLFILFPLTGFLVSLFFRKNQERAIYLSTFVTATFLLVLSVGYTIWWGINYDTPINVKEITLYDGGDYQFFIDLLFDEVTAVYCIISSFLTLIISKYSRVYMHKEEGYKRFFNTLLLFYFGIQVIIFSGNFETLFIGWEILGVSSFLLIAFYRNRYLPVRNAFKVFSVYRIADLGILVTMWLSHHLWHENITFLQLNNSELVHEHIQEHMYIGVIISVAILLSASVKSAQFPFSSWLPRAMEGPTPSSAIFYGSIAVHIGVFLMLRTYPFWSDLFIIKIIVVALGAVTTLMATVSARVQSSIKAQIAYSSVAQIGIIFIEIAFGFKTIALIHLSGNAFLRSYQLLISPSVVTYLIRDQFFNFSGRKRNKYTGTLKRVSNTLFVLGIKEWKLDNYLYKFLWYPLKWSGYKFSFLSLYGTIVSSIIALIIFIYILVTGENLDIERFSYLPVIFGSVALAFVLRAFVIRKNAYLTWTLLILSHFWISFAVAFNEHFNIIDIVFYLGGVVVAGGAGYYLLFKLGKKERFDLDDFYGHSLEHKGIAFGFLLSALALAGFPITTTFLGEDLLFTHIREGQIALVILISINFMVTGISVIRMYSRIFMGPNHKWYTANARRSA